MSASSSRLAALAEQRVGSSLRRGKYMLDALIGVGAMAAVYRATHRNGSVVAVKMLHTELVGDDSLHARFLREGYIANQVTHPGLVKVLDDDVDDDGATFLVMELLTGRTLEDEREALGGRIEPVRLLLIVRELLDVLAVVHAAGIVHRDIKPENIFLTSEGAVKLLDLGVARLGPSAATAAGMAIGSPAYMSPEQAMGENARLDARSDLYAVGAILFTLLTGHRVHEGANAFERMRLAATTPARSMVEVWPDAKGALRNLVDVALRFDRTQRWSSAAEMGRALDGVLDIMRPASASVPAPAQPAPPAQAAAPAPPRAPSYPHVAPTVPMSIPGAALAAPPVAPAPVESPAPAIPLPEDTVHGFPAPWSTSNRPPRGT
jgi:serine/threonine-protein kinase